MQEYRQPGFAELIEAAPDAIVCLAGDGWIALVNSRAERLFGHPRAELIGRGFEILVPEAERQDRVERMAAYLADPEPRLVGADLSVSCRRKDGSTFPAEIALAATGSPDGVLVTSAIRDLSEREQSQAKLERYRTRAERERLERQLQQTQRLESLGQLAGGVAHDFNNLLGVISNYAAFVAEAIEEQPSDDDLRTARADLARIRQAADRAGGLTRQLLSFARRGVVQPRVLALDDVVLCLQQLLQRAVGEHIELRTACSAGLDRVLADPSQIEQMLVNLAVNARDAMPDGGVLTIEAANVEVDEAYTESRADVTAGRYVAMKVSDTGTGMPADVLDRAFEPFFTTKPKGTGSGLGLSTVYGIAAQAGGCVRIYSEPGLGTTVTVLFPATSQPLPDGERAGDQPRDGNGELVLVVEDEPDLRELTRRILDRGGYRVLVASSGAEAIEAARSAGQRLDMLLTDVVMPGMQGREVAERIGEMQPGIPVLFMSGYTGGILDYQGALESGVSLIEKPFSSAALLAKVRELTGGR